MVRDQAAQSGALPDQPGHELLETLLLGVDRDLRDGRVLTVLGTALGAVLGPGQHLLARLLQQLRRRAFVEHLEVRRDARLQGKAPQERLAEGVDGQDLHAAGRVQHPREELPGAGQDGGIGRVVDQLAELLDQILLGQRRPARQAVGQAVGHLRRRRLGEGQAEDARRRGAVQHQAQYPVGQHLGLAGARRGGDPDRIAGPGRGALGGAGGGARIFGGSAHPSSSPPAPHSLTRDRCR